MLRVESNESKPMSELEAAKVLEPIVRFGLSHNPMWQIIRGWSEDRIQYRKNMSLPENLLCSAYILCDLQRSMMKRKKTGSNSILTRYAAAEAEEKARLEASTSGKRREGRGMFFFHQLH